MKRHSILCIAFLAMGGCALFPPSAPRVPPLPKGPVTPPKLSVSDVAMLQKIESRAVYMKAMASLAETHSSDELVKGFARQMVQDYDKTHVAAQKLATNFNLALSDAQSAQDKNRLTRLGKLYGRPFDRNFLYNLTHSSTAKERAELKAVQKNGSTAEMKSLAGALVTLLEQCQVQGNGLIHR